MKNMFQIESASVIYPQYVFFFFLTLVWVEKEDNTWVVFNIREAINNCDNNVLWSCNVS